MFVVHPSYQYTSPRTVVLGKGPCFFWNEPHHLPVLPTCLLLPPSVRASAMTGRRKTGNPMDGKFRFRSSSGTQETKDRNIAAPKKEKKKRQKPACPLNKLSMLPRESQQKQGPPPHFSLSLPSSSHVPCLLQPVNPFRPRKVGDSQKWYWNWYY